MLYNKNFLKLIYNGLLFGMPSYMYNPLNNNKMLAPITISPYSTYINFKLNDQQVNYLNDYIKNYGDLEIIPIKMNNKEKLTPYINVNIYNCTSPVFGDKEIIRCEINTYVKDNNNNKGTLILDYLSNGLSIDPVNIFKKRNNINFKNYDDYNLIECKSKKDKIFLDVKYYINNNKKYYISDKLVEYTDNIYYKNGIMDKVYYDSTLIKANIIESLRFSESKFKYKDLEFYKIDSIFYFKNNLNFVGCIWNNL